MNIHALASSTFQRFIQMWTSMVYSKAKYVLWHDKQCLLGECYDHGVDTLKICSIGLLDLTNLPKVNQVLTNLVEI
jgi:hypothetical protein